VTKTHFDQEDDVTSVLSSIRMPVQLLDDLKALARAETERTGETVTWARLLRDGARQLLKGMKRPVSGTQPE
jgi:hypothetical protein